MNSCYKPLLLHASAFAIDIRSISAGVPCARTWWILRNLWPSKEIIAHKMAATNFLDPASNPASTTDLWGLLLVDKAMLQGSAWLLGSCGARLHGFLILRYPTINGWWWRWSPNICYIHPASTIRLTNATTKQRSFPSRGGLGIMSASLADVSPCSFCAASIIGLIIFIVNHWLEHFIIHQCLMVNKQNKIKACQNQAKNRANLCTINHNLNPAKAHPDH